MIYAYSQNISVNQNEAIPFNSVAIKKGCTCILTNPNILLPRKGLYQITVCANASVPTATSEATQTLSLQISNSIAAKASTMVADANIHNLSVSSVVDVSIDAKCCNMPTSVSIVNTGAAANYSDISVIVTKIA